MVVHRLTRPKETQLPMVIQPELQLIWWAWQLAMILKDVDPIKSIQVIVKELDTHRI